MKPRLLFLNRSYWPDTEATGQLLTVLCEGLTDQFEVHVLAGQPNVASTEEGWQETDERNGVTIHRVKHTTLSKRNMFQKGINFLSFVHACQKRIGSLPRPDVVVFETDPFLLPFVADRFRRSSGCSMVGYLQDIYPDVAVALEKISDNLAIRKLRNSLFDIYRRCSRMVVLSKDMKQLLLEGDIPDEKVSIIPNWADTQQIVPVETDNRFRRKFGLDNKFVAMYSGNLGLTQRLEEFVEAAAILQDDTEIQFVFVGQGARKRELQQQAESLNLSNILFCDYQPLDELSHSLSAAQLHLVPLTADLSRCLMPSKLYGILAAGRPFLTNAPENSELFEITKSHGVGFAVKAGSPSKIAETIRAAKNDPIALRDMGHRARRLAEEQYTKTLSVAAFAKALSEVVRETSKSAVLMTRKSTVRRSFLERLTGRVVLRRHLPAAFGSRSFYVTPDSQLVFTKGILAGSEALTRIASDFVVDGDCVWDIGGKDGVFSMLAAHRTGHTGTVVCVVPDPSQASLIQHSAGHQDNRDRTINVLCAAVSATPGIVRFSVTPRGPRSVTQGDVHNSTRSGGSQSSDFSVSTTLDSMLAVLPPPTLIRIAMGNTNAHVLEGGRHLLKAHRPRVYLEVSRTQASGVAEMLGSLGYDLYDGDLPMSGQQGHQHCPYHTLAIPSERPQSQLAAAA